MALSIDIRMCIAISWPDVHTPHCVQLEDLRTDIPPYVLTNSDAHADNSEYRIRLICNILTLKLTDEVVFGSFIPDASNMEHGLVPIMKMIDLGFAQRRATPK